MENRYTLDELVRNGYVMADRLAELEYLLMEESKEMNDVIRMNKVRELFVKTKRSGLSPGLKELLGYDPIYCRMAGEEPRRLNDYNRLERLKEYLMV
jgi:hypothetical protein